jgi:hypothetical protein
MALLLRTAAASAPEPAPELATELTTELAELAELRAEKARLAVEEVERREQTARRSAAADAGLAA